MNIRTALSSFGGKIINSRLLSHFTGGLAESDGLSNAQIFHFCEQLTTLLSAGVTPYACLQIMLTDAENEDLSGVLTQMQGYITQGARLRPSRQAALSRAMSASSSSSVSRPENWKTSRRPSQSITRILTTCTNPCAARSAIPS